MTGRGSHDLPRFGPGRLWTVIGTHQQDWKRTRTETKNGHERTILGCSRCRLTKRLLLVGTARGRPVYVRSLSVFVRFENCLCVPRQFHGMAIERRFAPNLLRTPRPYVALLLMTRQIGYATAGLLRAIAQGYRYGLDIMEVTGLPSGTVYPTLTRLESRGFVAGQWESQAIADREKRPRRRYYKLTAAGRAALAESTRLYGAFAEETALRLKPFEGEA